MINAELTEFIKEDDIMAKFTLKDGTVFEGSVAEFKELSEVFGEESAVQAEEATQYIEKPAQVGDKIRIVAREEEDDPYEDGDEFTVKSVDSDGDIFVNIWPEGEAFVCAYEFEIIERPREPKLKVGDYAKVQQYHMFGAGNGDILKVTEVGREGCFEYRAEHLNGEEADIFREGQLAPATGEEVAVAKQRADAEKRKAAHAKLFTDHGRKVDEYKAGDIVEGERGMNPGEIIVGSIIEGPDNEGNFAVNSFVDKQYRSIKGGTIKPVTFVENRLDK